MINKKLIIPVIFLLSLTFILNINNNLVFAQDGQGLGVEYPDVLGDAPETTTTLVPEYVNYIFNFLIFISGFIALGVIIMAGYQYFTSAGSPEKMSDARDKIKAALLGLLILLGSYLILYNINPNLVSFDLPRLRPIISELTPGVLVCREQGPIYEVWLLQEEFKRGGLSIERDREIAKEIEELLKKIGENCYPIISSGDIRDDYDNKLKFMYFIPSVTLGGDGSITSITEYGAIVYEKTGFEGASGVSYEHLFTSFAFGPAPEEPEFPVDRTSSIKVFATDFEIVGDKKVTLYAEYNQNEEIFGAGVGNPWEKIYTCPGLICWENLSNLEWVPRSMSIDGELFVVLMTAEETSETFTKGIYNNLEAYSNIVELVSCEEYRSEETTVDILPGTYGGTVIRKCRKPAATELIIINGGIY